MAQAVAARARALLGTRFRPQGRLPEHGLDCVGLIALAGELPPEMVPNGYRLRSEATEGLLSRTFGGRVRRIPDGDAQEGDVLMVRAGVGQSHLVILVEGGFIHADARVGKVVERPGPVGWPVVASWRIEELD